MAMFDCRACGKPMEHSATLCPHCGASQGARQADPDGGTIPDGIKGWSWGAFLLNWIWAIGNRTWIGLLAAIPYVGIVMAIVLGFKGREWAWKNRRWESVEHFNRVQKSWSVWGVAIVLVALAAGLLSAIAMPAFAGQPDNARQAGGAAHDGVEQHGLCKGLDLTITADMLTCLDRKYAEADGQLNAIYKARMRTLDDAGKAALKRQQIAWIKRKETDCPKAGKAFEGGTLEAVLIADCFVTMTERRVAELHVDR